MEVESFNKNIYTLEEKKKKKRGKLEEQRAKRTELMKMKRSDTQLLCSLLMYIITQVWCQLCTGPCHQCPHTVPRCPPGVPLTSDSCGCCQVCSRQEGEACNDRLPCDTQRGLQCDYSASFPGGPGECVAQDELGCELNGRRMEEGQVFQPSCAQLCHCLGGGVTCVPLCTEDLQRPVDRCPNPQLIRLPGRCCKEWVCDGVDNSISSSSPAAEQTHQDVGLSGPSLGPVSNCIEWRTEWSPCSHSCGPGVSTRSSNRNWACRLQTETRLCQVRPCQSLPPGLRRPHPGSGMYESSYTLPFSVQLEHQGCWSTRAYRFRFCALTSPDGRCCSPAHTRTAWLLFSCPPGMLTHRQVMMIESCSCSFSNCNQPPATPARGPLPWL